MVKQYQNQYVVTLVNANHASSNWALVRKVESTTADIFESAQLSPILGYCPYLAENVMSLRYGIVAETWMRISRKRTRDSKDHMLIMIVIVIIIIIIIIIIIMVTTIMITNHLK